MTYAVDLIEIMDRHEARVKACGDKLMNSERDMNRLLEILNDKFTPVIKAALAVHAVSEMDAGGKEKLSALMERLADMSTAMYMAGMVQLPKDHVQ